MTHGGGLILDAHVHVGRWDDAVLGHTSATLRQVDRALAMEGIAGAVVTTSDQRQNGRLLQELGNEGALRYWFFPWVDPATAADDLAFLEENCGQIAGIKLHPSLSRLPVTEPGYRPFLDLADREGLAVLVHCGQWQEMASYRFVLDLAEQYLDLKLVMAHGGGNNAALRLQAPREIERRGSPPNIYLDLTGLGLWWAIEIAIRRLGADRFLFGSDFPLGHPKILLAMIHALRIPDSQKRQILGGNLLRLLEG